MRKPLPDLLKGLAVILMIQVHIMELFAMESIYVSWVGKISLFLGAAPAAPVFMVIMGYFVGQSQKSIGRLILRGVKLIGLGLLLNIGLNLHLLYRIIIGDFDLNPWEYIFGVDIFFLAGLSILFLALTGKLLRKSIIFSLILVLGISVLPYLLNDHMIENGPLRYFQAFFWGNYSWSYFPLLPWLSYPLTGYILAIYATQLPKVIYQIRTKAIVGFILAILIVLSFPWAIRITSNLSLYYHHGTIFFLWTIAFLAFWGIVNDYPIRHLNDTWIIKYLRWAGKHVTTIYVVQWLLIGNIATAIYKTQNAFQLIVWFAGVSLITSILVIIWVKWQKSRTEKVRF